MSKIFINGTFVEKEKANINVFDHGLLYGDGIYEGIRSYSGLVFQLDEHLERLFRSAKSLKIRINYTIEKIKNLTLKTLRENNLLDAYIRIILTRGVGKIGPDPHSCAEPNLIIITENLPNVHGGSAKERGLSLAIVSTRRDAIDATSHEIKSLNYLNSILAKLQANDFNADDAIMLDPNGFISESTICNIFMYDGTALVTPYSGNGILKGITRKNVIEIAQAMNIPVEQRSITPYELIHGKEVFVTGTHAEIMGVVKVDNIQISDGEIGSFTKNIISAFKKRIQDSKYGTQVYHKEDIFNAK